ncbi:MAG: transposase [Glaciimonas sp.]|nr:transposase [Glaciimonas sp.]
MTQPRSALISLGDTAWYHCVSRCVRRAFLCGEDRLTGKNFEHRRGWIAARIKELAAIFAIDIAAFAVMSNHYHVVAHVDRARALGWSVDEVLTRWTQLFTGPLLVRRYLSPARAGMDRAEIAKVAEIAALYRARLHDLSWFMRGLNESLARQANGEDGCTGRFWEGRFKSQALLDEQALLAAMAYVDLNPVRAGMAETPETSDYTSIQERLGAAPAARASAGDATEAPLPQAPLMPFDATGRTAWAIPFAFEDYVELVDWTGRALQPKKKGMIAAHQPKILERIGVDGPAFIDFSTRFLKEFGSAVGAPGALIDLCARRQIKYLRGIHTARKMFGSQPQRAA